MPSSARASTLTARMRRVSGEKRRRRRVSGPVSAAPARAARAGRCFASAIAVAVSDAIERLDLRELAVDHLELLAQPLDVAVDRAVVDIDVLAIGRVHELVAALDMAGPRRKRLQDEELGDGELDRHALPGAEMAGRVEHELAALNHRLGIGRPLAPRQFAAAQQRADPLDEEALRERLLDVVVGAHPEAEQLVDLVILRGEKDDGHGAL